MTPEEDAAHEKREAFAVRAEHDGAMARKANEPESIVRRSGGRFALALRRLTADSRDTAFAVLAIVVTPLLGGAVGMWIGGAGGPQQDANAVLDLTGLNWAVDGGVVGFCAGLLLGFFAGWLMWPDD